MSKRTIILAFFLFCMGYTFSQSVNSFEEIFSITPYVLDVKAESATIAIHLKKPMAAKIKVWMENGLKEYTSKELKRSHFIKISGLQSGKSYLYQVVCDKAQIATKEKDSKFQIRTSGKEGESFTFAVYGDPRPGDVGASYYHKAIIDQASMLEPQFCLVLGDMVDNGSNPVLWENFFRIESPIISKSAIYPVLGDNDVENGRGIYAQYFPMFEKGYYNFSWNGIQFFALNTWDTKGNQPSSELDLNSDQIKWFIAEMQKEDVKKAPYRIVFMHDPAYISRGRASEILLDQWVPLFQKYNVDIVFASWHLYERLQYKGVTYVISGGAGAEIIWMPANPAYPSQVDAQRHHFCRVDVNSNSLTIRAIADDGTVLDSYTISPKSQNIVSEKSNERLIKELNNQIIFNESEDASQLPIYLFSYDDCDVCKNLIKSSLPSLAKKHKLNLQLNYIDLSKQGAYDLFLNAGAEFGRQNTDIPTIFIGNKVLGGEQEISLQLESELMNFGENPDSYIESSIVPFQNILNTPTVKNKLFKSLSFGVVLSAGLLDGINPCAFTSIFFLIILLTLAGLTVKDVLYNGFLYLSVVFITYVVIGLSFFYFTKILLNNSLLSLVVNLSILSLVITLGVLSLLDYVQFKKIRSFEVILLFKKIKDKIRAFPKRKIAWISVSSGLGVLIAGMGLKCTGQVYIPIVTLISDPIHRLQAVLYLLLYSIAFIAPLILVVLIVSLGLSSSRIKEIFVRYLATVKLGLAVMFLFMALIIIYNILWII